MRAARAHCAVLLAIGLATGACSPDPSPAPTAPPKVAPSTGSRHARAPRAAMEIARRPTVAGSAIPARLEDLVTAADTFDTLRARFGEAAVVRETYLEAEGEQVPGWTLFPTDPARRIQVYPDDPGRHAASLVVRTPSTWARGDGVRTGLDTVALEALNGRPFAFAGFGWDYGGTVTDWKGGRLAHDGRFAGRVVLCEPEPPPDDYPAGDRDFMSDLAVVRAMPPKVCDFSVELAPVDAPP